MSRNADCQDQTADQNGGQSACEWETAEYLTAIQSMFGVLRTMFGFRHVWKDDNLAGKGRSIRTCLESDLDELPTRCAIAESCGLVSILSDIVSSHSSVGMRSIATSLLALIQNALGSRDIQKTEHHPLNSRQDDTSTTPPRNDVNEQLDELRTAMCNLTTQMAEQHEVVSSWMMKYDSILNHLDDKRKSDLLREYRFQRWSKTGADAVEVFDEDFIIKTGKTFRLRQRPENEETNFIPQTLFSPIISSDVAQLSFTVTHSCFGFRFGAVSAHLVDTGTQNDIWDEGHGIAVWKRDYEPPAVFQANAAAPRQKTKEIVLESDCRDGRRTLKLWDDGAVHSTFFSNLSLPCRFAITLLHSSVSVKINSLRFTAKPTLKGGTKEINSSSHTISSLARNSGSSEEEMLLITRSNGTT
ncbi:hypothetical protein BLNAU_3414 [Blattamonas nauphoetae]|uniref:Uncharacterized protein n=1 Tax=Blattamonas nauphoetae TaxID=2049346 RepID=A0ABQ9YCY0_9EUKA|nr:hypothetical protein BLNAU_3414 [Blattamonas nauphoetae]